MKILINGSTSGLGKTISEYYSRKKASLVCIGKNKMKIALLKKKVGSENLFFAIDLSKDKNLNIKAVIPVDLYGLPANYDKINNIAQMY